MRSRIRAMLFCGGIVATLSVDAAAVPSAGHAVVTIEGQTQTPLPDSDSRASVAPSADQLAAADAHGQPNCSTCSLAARRFRVMIVVG